MSFKSRLIPGLAAIGYLVLAIPVAIAVIITIWLTAAAAYENVRFVRCTDQLLSLIGTARDDAATDNDFGDKIGEDIVNDLMRRAQLLSQPMNGWGGSLRAQVDSSSLMRIETDVPMRACRRLALFFGKDAKALKLVKMQARDQDKMDWITIYSDSTAPAASLDYRVINDACGWGQISVFSLTLGLRQGG